MNKIIVITGPTAVGKTKLSIEIAKKYNVKWKCIGPITKKGNPHHPLYLSKNLPLVDFDIDAYMKR